MTDAPILSIALFAGALYLLKLWREDFLRWKRGQPNEKGFPGATSASRTALLIAAAGALILVGVETVGEGILGVSGEQSTLTVLFILPMIGAGILEEILFRGYLVVPHRGRARLILSCVFFSALFAALHFQYYLEIPEEGGLSALTLKIDAKAAWTVLLLFLNSIWFYAVRFATWNPHRSLLPCFVAHIPSKVSAKGRGTA